jgi:hypothetical protein
MDLHSTQMYQIMKISNSIAKEVALNESMISLTALFSIDLR